MTIDERADELRQLTGSLASILQNLPVIVVELVAAVSRRIQRAARQLRGSENS